MKKLFQLLIFILLTGCIAPSLTLLEEPKHETNQFYIKHYAYTLIYNEEYEQADWVAYELLETELQPNFERSDKFMADTMVVTGTATNADYLHSGYDKGHLAPAADMRWSEQAMNESFYFSNISPQLPGFNRGIWSKLEAQVRDWAKEYNCLYITTGPVFKDSIITIGENQVAIPSHFYKTILIYNDSISQGIGFIFPNQKCEGELSDYAVSIDSVEMFTGQDFYYRLPDKKERIVESNLNLSYWFK